MSEPYQSHAWALVPAQQAYGKSDTQKKKRAIMSSLCESLSRAKFCDDDTEPLNSLIFGVLQVFQSRQQTTQPKPFPFSTES